MIIKNTESNNDVAGICFNVQAYEKCMNSSSNDSNKLRYERFQPKQKKIDTRDFVLWKLRKENETLY